MPQVQRAYSIFEVKSFDDDKRIVTGIASTPSTDRMDDIVEPKGAVFKLPLPMLWQHDGRSPVGHVIAAKVSAAGIEVTCQFVTVDEPPSLKDDLDRAWAMVKAKLVRGFSIGFNAIESSDIEGTWGRRFTKWDWLELSAVTIPANADCSIQTIKSIDNQTRAALGLTRKGVVRLSDPPGASGITKHQPASRGPFVDPTQGNTMTAKTIQERIAEFEAKRAATLAQITEIVNKSLETGETLDAEQKTQRQTLQDEIATLDEHIKMLKDHEELVVKTAVAVTPAAGTSSAAATQMRNGVISVKRNLPPGTAFARYAQALAISKGNLMQAHEMSKRWQDTPEVMLTLKSAMAAGSTTDSDWAEPLVEYTTMASEFIDLLRPMTIVGKLTGLRQVPFNIRVAGKTQGSTVGWVGQGLAKPVSELKFNEVTLGFAKAAGIVVISQELARFSSPSAEALIRTDLLDTMAQFVDEQFINPAVAAVANVSPAGITNGVSHAAATGTTVAQITADVKAAFAAFIAANLAPTQGVWVMSPVTALGLSLIRTSQDVFAFPNITMNGGTFFGLPVVTSKSVPGSVSGGTIIVLMDQSEIFYADEGGVRLDASEQASLQMDSAPSAGAQSLVSLWQNNLVGIRAEKIVNWQRKRDAAVYYIDAVPAY